MSKFRLTPSGTTVKNASKVPMKWEPYLINVVDKTKKRSEKLCREIGEGKSIHVRQSDYSSAFPHLMRIYIQLKQSKDSAATPKDPKESKDSAATSKDPKESKESAAAATPKDPEESKDSAATSKDPKESEDSAATSKDPKESEDSACVVVIDGTALELQDTITINYKDKKVTVEPVTLIVPSPHQEAQRSRVGGSASK